MLDWAYSHPVFKQIKIATVSKHFIDSSYENRTRYASCGSICSMPDSKSTWRTYASNHFLPQVNQEKIKKRKYLASKWDHSVIAGVIHMHSYHDACWKVEILITPDRLVIEKYAVYGHDTNNYGSCCQHLNTPLLGPDSQHSINTTNSIYVRLDVACSSLLHGLVVKCFQDMKTTSSLYTATQ